MNRRIRNRTYGGVGGRRVQTRLLPDSAEFIIIIFILDYFFYNAKRFYISEEFVLILHWYVLVSH